MKHLQRKGLSFVEVVVATLIFSLTMAAFFGLHITAKNVLSLAHHKIVAMYWAQALLDAYRADLIGQGISYYDLSNSSVLTNTAGKNGVRTVSMSGNFVDPAVQLVAVRTAWTE